MSVRVLVGDTIEQMRSLPAASAQTCVTSPPYYGLRAYLPDGHPDKHLEIGLEETPDAYLARLVEVFREVRRVLADDGTCWVNLGDSYARAPEKGGSGPGGKNVAAYDAAYTGRKGMGGAKEKDLLGIPWAAAFALRADGWYLRSGIVWHKPNPMPESVRDRPTSAHEFVFLLTKSARYYYDADAIREPHTSDTEGVNDPSARTGLPAGGQYVDGGLQRPPSRPANYFGHALGRNCRSVWTIATQPYSGAHFATMPPDLAERCIKAGSKPGDTVLDPFGGAGTTGLVADRLGRDAILCELNPQYAALARERITADAPLLGAVA